MKPDKEATFSIHLRQIGHRFDYHWIFRQIDADFYSGQHYAVHGPNGSGKSTFMRILAAALHPAKGNISYQHFQKPIDKTEVYKYLSYAAPYIELIEELSLKEAITFHSKFKSFQQKMEVAAILNRIGLPATAQHKQIRYFSSGMKQRLKLALALFSDTPLLLLDEPSSNLDAEGIAWFHEQLAAFGKGRLLVIASNEQADFQSCEQMIAIPDYW